MELLPESAKQLITSGVLAHVVTINRDGSPQVSLVWADVAGDDVLFFARSDRVKTQNLRRDPRIVISFEDTTKTAGGLTQYLVVRGRATILPDQDITDLMDQLSQRYMGLDRFPFPRTDQILVRVKVERVSGMGPWVTPG